MQERRTPPKRVALLLSGELRTIEYCLPRQLAALRDIPHVSIFLSCWDSSRPRMHRGHFLVQGRSEEAYHSEKHWGDKKISKEDVLNVFPCVSRVSIEPYETLSAKHLTKTIIAYKIATNAGLRTLVSGEHFQAHILATFNQLYLLKRAFEDMRTFEKETDLTFDCVIRSRPDIVWKHKLQWPRKNQLIIDCLKTSRRRKGMIFDGFYICPRAWADILMTDYDTYLPLTQSKEPIFRPYAYTFTSAFSALGYFKKRTFTVTRSMGFLVGEEFFRYQISKHPNLDIVDSLIRVNIIR